MPLSPEVVKMLKAERLSGRPQLSEGTPAMACAGIAAGCSCHGIELNLRTILLAGTCVSNIQRSDGLLI
jgi:hypothetical protein